MGRAIDGLHRDLILNTRQKYKVAYMHDIIFGKIFYIKKMQAIFDSLHIISRLTISSPKISC